MYEDLKLLYGVYDLPNYIDQSQIWFENVEKDILSYTIDKFFMRFHKPLEIQNGFFRVIPNFPRYAITCSGRILDLKNKKTIFPQVNDYLYANVYCPAKDKNCTIGIHRLVGLAWVNNPDVKNKIFINHIDGNKQNNHYKNIEWVTPRENIVHAVTIGLRKKAVRVRVFDIKTQEEHNFPSLSQAGEAMGYRDRVSKEILNLTFPESLVKQRYEVKLGDDDSPWYYLNKTVYEPPARFKISVLKDGKVYKEYPGNRQLIKDWKLWNISNNTELLCRIAKEKYPEYDFLFEDRNPILPVQARNIKTGLVLDAESRNEAARKTGVPRGIVKNYVKNGRNIAYNDWQFRFKSDEPWENPEEKLMPRCIAATNLSTGEVKVFSSIRACSKDLSIEDRKAIVLRIRNGNPYQNYSFREM